MNENLSKNDVGLIVIIFIWLFVNIRYMSSYINLINYQFIGNSYPR